MKFYTPSLLLFLLLLSASVVGQTPFAPFPNANRSVVLTEAEYTNLLMRAESPDCRARMGNAKRGLMLRLGGGLGYFYGADNAANQSFSSSYGDWFAEGMIGYVFNYDGTGLGTGMGVFVRGGNQNTSSIQKFLEDGKTGKTADQNEAENRYYQAELGVLLFETIRLSTGAGYQEFVDNANANQQVNYYSSTAGLHVGSRFFKVVFDVNFMYGRGLSQTLIRPSLGLMLQL
ncbi:MAG: hypothetical protein ACFCUI_00640 [Bernardetiaceae bacterium]